jgi:type I restriction enzyme, S subunit
MNWESRHRFRLTEPSKYYPLLRFLRYEGNWRKRQLSELSESISSGKTKPSSRGDFPVYGSTGVIGLSPNYTHDHDSILIARVGANAGRTNLVSGRYSVTDNTLILIPKTGVHLPYLFYFLKSFNLNRLVFGTGQPLITGGSIKNISALFPSAPEQVEIADFLSSVDKRIGQLTEKKALLEEYKKGVMQQLFSREIRFKDDNGEDFPEWEEYKLGDIAMCLDHLRRPVNATDREKMKGDIPYYGANGIQGYVNDYLFDEDLTLLAEDGGNFDEYATRPIAQRVLSKAWVNNHAHILRAIQSLITPAYLFHSLAHKDIRKYINGSSRAKLNKGEMLRISMTIPSISEQSLIADFLAAIDRKIESVDAQIVETQTFKKGLLQQMFV